jgi:hypothetical protein
MNLDNPHVPHNVSELRKSSLIGRAFTSPRQDAAVDQALEQLVPWANRLAEPMRSPKGDM